MYPWAHLSISRERGLVYCTKGCVRLMDLLVEEEEQDGIFCVPLSVFDSILHPFGERPGGKRRRNDDPFPD